MGKIMNVKSIAIGIALGMYGSGAAFANPTGAHVVHGSASFHSPNADTLQITNTPNAIINWQDFSIGHGELTEFIQQSAQSAVLNRVVGNNLSEIHGTLSSNGRVFLINQAGIVLGENALVDTAGLLASSLDISNADFLAGDFHFAGTDAGAVINRGVIAAGPGGEVVLIAPQIENSGAIRVQDGALILAAGESVTLTSWDLDGVEFEVQAPDNQVLNLGELIAEQGAVGLFAGSIRHEGIVEANGLSVDAAGNIVLSAQQDITITDNASVSASGTQGGEIAIANQQGTTLISGDISATGSAASGGTITLEGKHIGLIDEAVVDASGANGGGDVYIGGGLRGQDETIRNAEAVYLGEQTGVHADALENGDGGTVIAYATDTGRMHGSISAKGGADSGDGGFIETSAGYIEARGDYNASASNGENGTWLLDPYDLEIVSTTTGGVDTTTPGLFVSNASPSQLQNSQIETALASGNVTLETGSGGSEDGNITVNAPISWMGGSGTRTLTMNAHNNITVNRLISATGSSNQLNVVLNADHDNDENGVININAMGANSGSITSNGGYVDLQGRVITIGSTAVINTTNPMSGPGGNVALRNYDFILDGTIIMPDAQLLITTYTPAATRNIDFGDGLNTPADLGVSQAKLDQINLGTAGTLRLGDSSYEGDIYISETVDMTTTGRPQNLTLETQGDIRFVDSVATPGAVGQVVLPSGGIFTATAHSIYTHPTPSQTDVNADGIVLTADQISGHFEVETADLGVTTLVGGADIAPYGSAPISISADVVDYLSSSW